jgi:arylsulfatase A-like enzyme
MSAPTTSASWDTGRRTSIVSQRRARCSPTPDWYGQQSCTAGRAAFITGQSPIRTGLTKVGLPGADLGLRAEDPTIADLLKPLGYVTGQFGKNHLGDRDEFLPTAHGFDEFFGNLYHLNAEEEPENPDYPKDPEFRKKFGPRGVLHSFAQPDGTQKIEDTGPLTTKRMETVDEEFLDASLKFIEKAVSDDKPFFCWWNSTRMHCWTRLKKESEGKTGLGVYPDGMVEHDGHVGKLLDKLDELGIADNTIVMYSTDNGAEVFSHTDMLPTLLAVAGETDIVERLKKGYKSGNKTYKVHIDGYNLLPFLKGEAKENPRKGFLYWSDDGDLMALRAGHWKVHFMVQEAPGVDAWVKPFVSLRMPELFHLRSDPFEKGDESMFHDKRKADRMFTLVPAQTIVGEFLKTFQEFPPRQKPSSFSIDEALEKARAAEKQIASATSAGGMR